MTKIIGKVERSIYKSGESLILSIPDIVAKRLLEKNPEGKIKVSVEILGSGDILIKTSEVL